MGIIILVRDKIQLQPIFDIKTLIQDEIKVLLYLQTIKIIMNLFKDQNMTMNLIQHFSKRD